MWLLEEKMTDKKKCPECKGKGEFVDVENREHTICPVCNGTGVKQEGRKCKWEKGGSVCKDTDDNGKWFYHRKENEKWRRGRAKLLCC